MGLRPAILLVDNNPDVLIVLQSVLMNLVDSERYEVLAFVSPDEALAHVHMRLVPLVVTSYKLVGMNGLQLTTAVKNVSPFTQVVFMTAYTTPELSAQAQEHQVDVYLLKPFELHPFERICQNAIAMWEAFH